MSGAHQMPRAWAENDVRLLRYGKTKSIFKKGIPEVGDYKKCPRCGEMKHWTEFGVRSSGRLHTYCKPCLQVRNTTYMQSHKEELRQYNRKKEVLAMRTRYKKSHAEEVRKSQAAYRQSHTEERKASTLEWKRKHPGSNALYIQRRRTRKIGNGGSFTNSEWESLLVHYDYRCLCCGRDDVKLERDHVSPLSKGGTSYISNIQPLCKSCNSSKRGKYIDYRPDSPYRDWT